MSATQSTSGRRVVVIGSGFGGLAAAIRLQARGYQVTIVDQRDQPGGRAYVYRDQGFVFDAGPTVVTAPFLFDELFSLCGQRREDHIQFVPVDPFYRIRFHDGRIFDYSGDAERMAEEVRDQPARRRRVRPLRHRSRAHLQGRLLKTSPTCLRPDERHAAHRPSDDEAALVPHGASAGVALRQAPRPAHRAELPSTVGRGNPHQTTSIYALIPLSRAQVGCLVRARRHRRHRQALVDLFTSQGGTLRQSETVEGDPRHPGLDRAQARGVRLRGGAEIPADLVVSNADVGFTYRYLLPESARQKYSNRRVESMRY